MSDQEVRMGETKPPDFTVDRTDWLPGPWDGEPDRVEWRDPSTRLPCLALRHPAYGSWCGYVAIPPGHPWHHVAFSDLDEVDGVSLSYADACEEGGFICHVPEPGEPTDVWWVGFDCNHAFDLQPGMMAREHARGWPITYADSCTYRPIAYVRLRCAEIAAAALKVSP